MKLVELPELRTATIFRQHALRELWAVARLFAGPRGCDRAEVSRRCMDRIGRWRGTYCYRANAAHNVCNWLISPSSPEQLCVSSRHNRIIPDLSQSERIERWRLIEIAKHRLFYTLLRLRLPVRITIEAADGLAFDFLADTMAPSRSGPARIPPPGVKLNTCHNVVYHTLPKEGMMNGLIYLIGLIVVIMFILSFLGLR